MDTVENKLYSNIYDLDYFIITNYKQNSSSKYYTIVCQNCCHCNILTSFLSMII